MKDNQSFIDEGLSVKSVFLYLYPKIQPVEGSIGSLQTGFKRKYRPKVTNCWQILLTLKRDTKILSIHLKTKTVIIQNH
jgi:predicted metalloprotease